MVRYDILTLLKTGVYTSRPSVGLGMLVATFRRLASDEAVRRRLGELDYSLQANVTSREAVAAAGGRAEMDRIKEF